MRLYVGVLFSILVTLGSPVLAETTAAGFVIEVDGEWCVAAGKTCKEPLRLGTVLAVGQSILPAHRDPLVWRSWFFGAILRDGTYFGHSCAEPRSCDGPVRVPGPPETGPSRASRVYAAVKELFVPRPTTFYSSALSRGTASSNCSVNEGVALAVADGWDASEVLMGGPPGPACQIEVRGLDRDGKALDEGLAQGGLVENGKARIEGDFEQGLYRVDIITSGAVDEPTPFAWVLFVKGDGAEAVRERFGAARRDLASWHLATANGPGAVAYLRAYLLSLARNGAR